MVCRVFGICSISQRKLSSRTIANSCALDSPFEVEDSDCVSASQVGIPPPERPASLNIPRDKQSKVKLASVAGSKTVTASSPDRSQCAGPCGWLLVVVSFPGVLSTIKALAPSVSHLNGIGGRRIKATTTARDHLQ